MPSRPNLLVILIDDLRFDEFGAGGHPYMKTPHIDRLAHEGALFERAFHTTPICSPNRASIVTGQYASRHGIIDNVARDASSHRLAQLSPRRCSASATRPRTSASGTWATTACRAPGYDYWVSYDGHGRLNDPRLNEHGKYVAAQGLHHRHHERDGGRLARETQAAARQAVVAVVRAQGGASRRGAGGGRHVHGMDGYVAAERHKDLYEGCDLSRRSRTCCRPTEVVKQKPAWAEALELRKHAGDRASCSTPIHSGEQEEIRLRAR